MQSSLFQWVGEIGIFMICAKILLYFRPKGSYEKYFKLFFGMLLLIRILQPLGDLFGKDFQTSFAQEMEAFSQGLKTNLDEAEKRGIFAEDSFGEENSLEGNLRNESFVEGDWGEGKQGLRTWKVEPVIVEEIRIILGKND